MNGTAQKTLLLILVIQALVLVMLLYVGWTLWLCKQVFTLMTFKYFYILEITNCRIILKFSYRFLTTQLLRLPKVQLIRIILICKLKQKGHLTSIMTHLLLADSKFNSNSAFRNNWLNLIFFALYLTNQYFNLYQLFNIY